MVRMRRAILIAKSRAKAALRQAGWEVRRSSVSSTGFPALTSLETAMTTLLACQGHVRVVQVGANDGVFNDPLHSFLMQHRYETSVLLIEPQPYLIPILSDNYKNHPAHFVANLAVGQPGTLSLYAVDEQCWLDCVVPYADGWPPYRAPTGITSGEREYVLEWLRRHYKGAMAIEDAVVAFTTKSMPLIDLITHAQFELPVDVLQVDTEGFDDEVLYHSSLDHLAPKIINFEHTALSSARLRKLATALTGMGYVLQSTTTDTLAIRTISRSEVP
jgi:FkbM family methyltransferase